MFGPPGRAYVYKCHLYPPLNVVTEPEGRPGAVLLRALQPLAGLRLMRKRRSGATAEVGSTVGPDSASGSQFMLTRGPGRLCLALGVGLAFNNADLLRGPLSLARPVRPPRLPIRRSTRIGLKGAAALLRWRFYAAGNPWVSNNPRPRPDLRR